MDLVNLMYRYINKFINSNTLLDELKKLDLSNFSKEEKRNIDKLILDVENIINTIPNELDEIEKNRLKNLDNILGHLEKAKSFDNDDENAKKFVDKQYKKLKKDKKAKRDGGKLYTNLFQLLTNNLLIVKYAKKMNDEELLEFITDYISAPIPPVLNQESFNDLVKVGIKEDKREALWRLAFNYNRKEKDFSLIVDYFVEKRDDYYLTELISAVQEDLDINKLIDKIMATKDKKFISGVANRGKNIGLITEDEIINIKKKYDFK